MDAYDTPRFWINTLATITFTFCAGFYPFFWLIVKDIAPSMQMYSVLLVSVLVVTGLAPLAFKQKPERLDLGCFLVLSAIAWFVAPYRPFEFWAVNPWLISDAIKALFGGFRFTYNHHYVNVIALNLFWFMIFALGVAVIKSSSIWRSLSSGSSTSNRDASSTARLADAKWATRKQVAEKLSVPGGIVLGEMTNSGKESPSFEPHNRKSWGKQGKGQLITMSPETGNGHVFVISESSGFKTTGMVIPNIITYDYGPIFVLDPKGDLYARTAHRRREMGYNPIVITAKEGLDPLKMLEPLLDEHPSIVREMAANLLPQGAHASEEANFFRERGLDLLAPLLYLAIKQTEKSAPEYIAKFLSQSHGTLLEAASKLAANYDEPFISGPMARVAAVDSKGFESFIRTVSNKFAFSEYPDVKGFVEQSADSDRHKLALHPKTDVYLNISTATLETFDPIARLLLASFLTAAKMTEQPENPSCRRLFILDEAKGLGNMDILSFIRDEGRAVGLHLMLFYQTWDQFKKIWGDGAGAWEDSTEARIMGASQNASRAQALQDMIGHDTFKATTQNTSRSARGVEVVGTRQQGLNEQIKEAPLMTKADISTIKRHGSLILTRSVPPILASKAIYFTRNDMSDLVRSSQDVRSELAVTQTARAFQE